MSKRLRIGYVNWSLGLGGAEQVIIHLALAMARRGHEVTIFTLNDPGAFAAQVASAKIPVVALHKRGRYDASVLWRLAGEFRRRRLDVVHTHLWGGNLWGRLAARLAGVLVVVATEHNLDTWKPGYYVTLDRWLAPRTTALVAVSEQVRDFYEARGIGRGRWRVIHNGLDASTALPRGRGAAYRALGIGDGELVVGWIGRFVPAKAPELFVRAAAAACRRMPSLTVLMVGDGPLRGQIAAQVAQAGLTDRIILTGLRQDVPELLAGMDALVFSSEREGLSIAMLEAMAAGVPVVATRVGGTPELIDSGATGVLVEPGSAEPLAEAIVALLSNPSTAQAIRDAARARVDAHFSLRAMVDAYEALYRGAGGSPIAVVYVIDDLARSGAQRQLVELVKRLPRDRWQPVVICLSTTQLALRDELTAAGVPIHAIDQHGTLDLRCLRELIALMRRLRPSIVHTWLFTADCYGRVAARATGVPHTVCAIRNTVEDMRPHERLANRLLSAWTSRVTINAEAIRAGLERDGGIPGRKIVTIPNGMALTNGLSTNGVDRSPWSLPSGPLVGMIARLSPQKDHATFLDAATIIATQMPAVSFVLAGDGPLRDEIERRIERLGLRDRVRLLGHRSDVPRLLRALEVCVLATHYEGCSNVIMEAMAAGKPVIATDVGGNRELIVDGRTGRLVPPRDAHALAEAMLALLRDPRGAARMGAAGRERIATEFGIDRALAKTTALYDELL